VNIENTLWVEKYRPKKLDDIILPEKYREYFSACIKNKEIDHLLLYGPPGSGKTAISRILCSPNGILEYPSDNLLFLNGSAKKTRGIDFVNDVIEEFLKAPPGGDDKQKIVFIDEADYLTDASIHSLRGIIEQYNLYGRFILTCNYVHKFPDAIDSRILPYEFKKMPFENVIDYVKNILISENVIFDDKDIEYICDELYPDIRKIVNTIQRYSKTGKLDVDRENALTIDKLMVSTTVEFISSMKKLDSAKSKNSINSLYKILEQSDIDFGNVYKELFYNKNVPAVCKIIINKFTNTHVTCVDPRMNYMSMIFEVGQSLKGYVNMVKS